MYSEISSRITTVWELLDDIIHLKHKNIYWALSTYLSLDAKFVYLAIVMVENQGVRNSSFLLGLISPNYVRQ